MTLDELLDAAEGQARRVLIGGKEELTPLAHLVRPHHGDIVIATPWRNATEKDITFRTLAALMRDDQIVRYALLHEGWMRSAEPGELSDEQVERIKAGGALPRIDPICQHPKRIEVVIAIGVEKGRKAVRMWETKRDKRGNCVELAAIDTEAEQWRGAALELMDTCAKN
jgi:hypothetical protein